MKSEWQSQRERRQRREAYVRMCVAGAIIVVVLIIQSIAHGCQPMGDIDGHAMQQEAKGRAGL